MKRNIALVMCSIVMMFGIGMSANAQDFINPSFESGGVNGGWSSGSGNSGVIEAQGISPNVAPTHGNEMLYLASDGSGDAYDGGGAASLATDQLINTGIAETNSSLVSSLNIGASVPSYISYDMSFLASNDNTCDNYVAVLLIHNATPGILTIEDAKCYNSTGNGFVNTNNGPVSCSPVIDDNIAHAISSNFDFAGRSNFFTDTLPVPVPDNDNRYSLQLVTGQIFDGVCDLDTEDNGALFDNFNLLTLNLDGLDPSQAGVQNTLSADGFTPNGDVTFIYSFNLNTPARVAPDDICQGLDTPLVNPRLLATLQADGEGGTALSFNIPASLVGITAFIQAVDITTCLGSNVNEETIGDTPGGQPPVLLPLNPGTAGQQNTLSATGATPNSDVRFIWGFNQQVVTANNICPGFQSGILNPRTLPIVQTDGAGAALLNVNVPGNLAGISLVLQAVDITTCTGSNVNPETL